MAERLIYPRQVPRNETRLTLNQLSRLPYIDHGRDENGVDCYGMVCLARRHLFDAPMPDQFPAIHPDDKAAMSAAFLLSIRTHHFAPIAPKAGAIGGCFGRDVSGNAVLLHVGVVVEIDGARKVLHTSRAAGAEIIPIRAFERLALEVKYFDNR